MIVVDASAVVAALLDVGRDGDEARAVMLDGDEFHASRAGVPTAVVSVPLRYTHTQVETAQLSDVEQTIAALTAAVLRIDRETSFAR